MVKTYKWTCHKRILKSSKFKFEFALQLSTLLCKYLQVQRVTTGKYPKFVHGTSQLNSSDVLVNSCMTMSAGSSQNCLIGLWYE